LRISAIRGLVSPATLLPALENSPVMQSYGMCAP
jgi:hypothetical protein